MKKNLKFRQNFSEEPSLAVKASTGKAAININGTTLQSAFHLPVKQQVHFLEESLVMTTFPNQ